MNLEKILQNFGLNERQAKIYLACLELGSATAQKISVRTQLPRSTCYEILNSLRVLGFVSLFHKKKIKFFSAQDPKNILSLSQQKNKILESALPKLTAMYGTEKNPASVRMYHGKVGLQLILEEILHEAHEMYGIASADDLFAAFPHWKTFVERRVQKKIPLKILMIETEKSRERKLRGTQDLREVRFVKPSYNFVGLIYLWKNKIAMFSLQKDFSLLVIENKEFFTIQKMMFDEMWNNADSK